MVLLSISETILFFITGVGTLQGILLALLIYFHPKSDRSANIFLALYVLCLSIVATTPLVERIVTWQKSFFIEPFPFLFGPLLYLYLRSFKETITWRKAFPHILPFFIFFFISYWFFSIMGSRYPFAKDPPVEALLDPLAMSLGSLRLFQAVLYYFLARHILRQYQRSIHQLFSETSRIDLHWARWLINGYLFIVAAGIVIYGMMLRFPENFTLLLLLNVALTAPYIYIVSYKGIMQPTVWQLQQVTNKEVLEEEMHEVDEMESIKTNGQKLRPEKAEQNEMKIREIVSGIIALMEKEKLYQETELTLQNLADKLQCPSYQVSQAINEGLKKNFYDLVNSYRVEEAKRLLLDQKSSNFTILSVGFEAGFNSKTTFNTVFKKFTGLTPSDFRNRQRTELVHRMN